MSLVEIIVLAIVQGMTEFLPVSSSGHLILVPALFGWEDQGLAFDVAVHVGTLLAVVAYFRVELAQMTLAVLKLGRGDQATQEHFRLALLIVLATIPVGLAGLFGRDAIETYLRSPVLIAATTAVFGVLLWVSSRWMAGTRSVTRVGVVDALVIGTGQALALVPGTSRSGITMTMGMARGLSADAAARFSFLMSIPVIVLAGGWEALKLARSEVSVDVTAIALGTLVSAVFAYATIAFFLKVLARIGMLGFMVYRLALAAVILYILA
ncbi:MAG: undecaprenyl-diphosphate phosphatase [Pseudomonadota bacterium]